MIRTPFNRDWTVGHKGSPFDAFSGGSAKTAVTLPHDGLRDLPRSADSPNGSHTGYYPSAHLEYTKTIDVPAEWRDQSIVLDIEGAYRDAVVYVNGDFAAQRPNGYVGFSVALDPFLRFGEANTISVEVRTHEDSRWYAGAGLYRNVWLVTAEPVHIPLDGVRITTPVIEPDLASVITTVEVANETRHTRTVRVETEIRDDADVVLSLQTAPITLLPGTTGRVHLRHYLSEPALWNVDDPRLHTAHTRVREGDTLLDEDESVFGVRSVTVDPVHGLRINGRSVKLRGGCIHHDNGPLGSAAHPRAEERRVQLLKAAGYNAVRSSHNNISRAFLDACDRHGLLVWDEVSDVWTKSKTAFDYSLDFPEWWERDVESMVAKDFNHPSVIMYSTGNEIFETGSAIGSTWGRALAEKVRSLDDSRLITNAINGMVATMDVFAAQMASGDTPMNINALMGSMEDMMNTLGSTALVSDRIEESQSQLDVSGINYAEARYAIDAEHHPNRILVGSETFPRALDRIWPLVEQHPTVIGDFAWTAWDYIGEASIGRPVYPDDADVPTGTSSPYPWMLAQSGTIDILGNRRPVSFWQETVWGLRSQPYIAVQRPEHHGREVLVGGWSWDDVVSSWSWAVPPGSAIKVDVYSDADEVELRRDGTIIGRAQVGVHKACIAKFDTEYHPGELTAIAIRDGIEIGSSTLRTRSDIIQLALTPDRTELTADGGDLAYLSVELSDETGTIATDVATAVSVEIEGPGILAGFGSAQPDSIEEFAAATRTTYDGRALAIIRPTGPGTITVRAAAAGLPPQYVNLTAR
ncbi:glycoside hydrolase family 2 TIM barrel-domain containing protein [Plantibacter sp. MPB07]|uniref:glycoside hydrolase family 2 TIM barrel-domain containing protein n=1 Tax=Plantibacter sp. MPB07 TaxID=3388853 RepID=UPI0039863A9A